MKLKVTDDIFLEDISSFLENGYNLEQALFNVKYMSKDVLLEIQLGRDAIEALSVVTFQYPVIINLLSTLSNSNYKANIERIKTVASLIKKRNETLEKKENIVRILNRRLKIIRFITLIIIAIIGGIAPFFSGIYSFLKYGSPNYSFSLISPMSISFLLINLLNNYFLLSISKEGEIKIKLVIVAIVHILVVFLIKIFFGSNFIT